jgi:hypothetical protein
MELRRAFARAGWQVLNAANSPKQVKQAACTIIPIRTSLTGGDMTSIKEFYYYEARNAPASVTGYKYGRYVHVVGAHNENPPPERRAAFGLAFLPERCSYVFVGAIIGFPFSKGGFKTH